MGSEISGWKNSYYLKKQAQKNIQIQNWKILRRKKIIQTKKRLVKRQHFFSFHFLLAVVTAITTLFVVGIEYIFCGNNNTHKGWSWKTMACIRFYLYTQTAFAAGIADFLRFACFKWNSFFLSLHSFTPFACLVIHFSDIFVVVVKMAFYCEMFVVDFKPLALVMVIWWTLYTFWFIENGTCTEHM